LKEQSVDAVRMSGGVWYPRRCADLAKKFLSGRTHQTSTCQRL